MLTTPKHYRLTFSGSVKPPAGVDPKLHSSISTNCGLIAYSDYSWRNPDKLYLYDRPAMVWPTANAQHSTGMCRRSPISLATKRLNMASYACEQFQFIMKVLSNIGFGPKDSVVLVVASKQPVRLQRTYVLLNALSSSQTHYFPHLVDHRVVARLSRTKHESDAG